MKKRCVHDGAVCEEVCRPGRCYRGSKSIESNTPWNYIERYEYQVGLLWNGSGDTFRELFIVCTGLLGEMGEVAEVVLGIDELYHHGEKRKSLLLELGDVLYYTIMLRRMNGFKLDYEFLEESIEGKVNSIEELKMEFIRTLDNLGNVIEFIKKRERDGKEINYTHLHSNLNSVVLNLSNMAQGVGSSLEEVMMLNIEKLEKKWKPKF